MWMRSPTRKLSEPCRLGIFMEASSWSIPWTITKFLVTPPTTLSHWHYFFTHLAKPQLWMILAHLTSPFLFSHFKTWQETVILICRRKSLQMNSKSPNSEGPQGYPASLLQVPRQHPSPKPPLSHTQLWCKWQGHPLILGWAELRARCRAGSAWRNIFAKFRTTHLQLLCLTCSLQQLL